MKILVTGATGFVGRMLVARLSRDGHTVVAYTRNPTKARATLGATVEIASSAMQGSLKNALRGCDAVVNLQGENLFSGRWTASRKERFRNTRIDFTRELAEAISALGAQGPKSLVSASAVGYYGANVTEPVAEDAPVGEGFLAELCQDWEQAAFELSNENVRVTALRIGVVLGKDGGAMQKMLLPFKLGLGGRLGSGHQHMAWIHITDLVSMICAALTDEQYEGAINATASTVSNREFTSALGKALNRPTVFPVPGPALKLALGQASSVLLGGQNVASSRATDFGFEFAYPDVDSALGQVMDEGGVTIERSENGDYVLTQELVVGKPLDEIFDFFSRAENLGVITPTELDFAIRGGAPEEMKEGVRLEYDIKLGPLPMRWVSLIDEWKDQEAFADSMLKGPYSKWHHRHSFEARGEDTVITDRVAYRIPMGIFGRVAHAVFVKAKLTEIFAFRSYFATERFGPARHQQPMKRAS